MAFVASSSRPPNCGPRNAGINEDKEDSSPVDCDVDEATPLTRSNDTQVISGIVSLVSKKGIFWEM